VTAVEGVTGLVWMPSVPSLRMTTEGLGSDGDHKSLKVGLLSIVPITPGLVDIFRTSFGSPPFSSSGHSLFGLSVAALVSQVNPGSIGDMDFAVDVFLLDLLAMLCPYGHRSRIPHARRLCLP